MGTMEGDDTITTAAESIAPLTGETFVLRLESLTRAVAAVNLLRRAFLQQNPDLERGLSRDPQSAQ